MKIKGRIFETNETLLTAENGKITGFGGPETGEVLDFGENLVLPGFIDVHTHGAVGVDTMDATDEAMQKMKKHMAAHGVTAFLPTTVTTPKEDLCAAIRAAERNAKGAGAEILGVHLEGPYFSPKVAGAQNPAHLGLPDVKEIDAILDAVPGFVRIMSLAPELPGAKEAVAHLRSRGVVAAMGHTAADYETAMAAIACGVTEATHLFNCMTPLGHRAPGVAGAALEAPGVYAELICDGVHVSPAAAKIAIRAKGSDKVILISDSMRAAGMPDGEYDLGGQRMRVVDGVARTEKGNLAGSTSNVLECFRNVVKWGISLPDAVHMASTNPAASIGAEVKGKIRAGADADFVVLSPQLDLVATIVGGNLCYRA
ncbi:MAG: N-acetylglucosamine-6-phosphate deacetylase [Clostridia bacterium]|nr:N-acetylglucosamine-6-phosphate deacetylase [Oscillospiraceae bacterium]MBQ7033087.1 N-acetylglucosamine-6-phosphate deacetylase [Clostridia bacterium]